MPLKKVSIHGELLPTYKIKNTPKRAFHVNFTLSYQTCSAYSVKWPGKRLLKILIHRKRDILLSIIIEIYIAIDPLIGEIEFRHHPKEIEVAMPEREVIDLFVIFASRREDITVGLVIASGNGRGGGKRELPGHINLNPAAQTYPMVRFTASEGLLIEQIKAGKA